MEGGRKVITEQCICSLFALGEGVTVSEKKIFSVNLTGSIYNSRNFG